MARTPLNHRAMVTISISVEPDLLEQISQDVKGKSRSEKLRKCLELGFQQLTKHANPSQGTDRGV